MRNIMSESVLKRIERDLKCIAELKQIRTLSLPHGHDFCSNDYLALSRHPEIIEAVMEDLAHSGLGSTSSRFIRGERDKNCTLEKRLAEFKRSEKALLFSSGYSANIGALSCLIKKGDLVFSDALNHASIIDGLRLSKAQIIIYPHLDVQHLRGILKDTPQGPAKFLITESLFSMDGDIAPLPIYADLCHKYDVALMVDEAHAVGIIGQNGSGLIEHFGLEDEVLLSINGLGKAFGCYGAFAAAKEQVIEYLVQTARTLMFSTAPPPVLLSAIDRALSLVKSGDHLRKKLFHNIALLNESLTECGLIRPDKELTPIMPIMLKNNHEAMEASNKMRALGYDIRAIRPPTVPEGSARLRLCTNVTHTDDLLLEVVSRLREVL